MDVAGSSADASSGALLKAINTLKLRLAASVELLSIAQEEALEGRRHADRISELEAQLVDAKQSLRRVSEASWLPMRLPLRRPS